jgi:hypothetical protein
VIGFRRPAGDLVWISLSSRPLTRPEEGMPYAVVLSFVDVTERRRSGSDRSDRPVDEPLADGLRE